ncbi:L,D-transpeptidase [Luteipulveratus halotolerans]|uniref:L,D-transpeptidase n=1 Tax=Luteipulveratus halotolerans TaxID=1631356 RepID=UPI000681683E|nr:L,D-transpeptidase [Luteipulveratus halotolerans]
MASQPEPSGRSRLATTLIGVVAGFTLVALVVVVAVTALGDSGGSGHAAPHTSTSSRASRAASASTIPVPAVPPAELARLPRSTTEGSVPGAPVDLHGRSHGVVVNLASATTGFAEPGAKPVTVVPASQLGNPTWLPVLEHRANWLRVRLPAKPNGATAWIADTGQRTATTAWAVRIDLSKGSMTITQGARTVGTWPVGRGRDATPTPQGETFLLSGFVDPAQDFSPVIYALGAHSGTLDSYGGGPGTVAVHGWPTVAGRTGKVSHGCVRVPDAALHTFGTLPAGTPVSITA